MLANSNRDFLSSLMIPLFLIAVTVIVVGIVWAIIKTVKSGSSNYIIRIGVTLLSIIIAAASWFLNLGWLRIIMTILLIPIFHGIIYFISNIFFAKYTDQSPKMSKLNSAFMLTYLTSYLLMPDAGDVGGMYFFFGLIHNDFLSDVVWHISSIAFIGHIILFVEQLVQIRKIKKSISDNQNFCPESDNIPDVMN